MTIYSLIQKDNNWELVEGISLYTPYTSFYDIDLTEIASDLDTTIKLLNKQVKSVLIHSKIKGNIVNIKGVKQILRSAKLKTKL